MNDDHIYLLGTKNQYKVHILAVLTLLLVPLNLNFTHDVRYADLTSNLCPVHVPFREWEIKNIV